jgi:hypothetical protein
MQQMLGTLATVQESLRQSQAADKTFMKYLRADARDRGLIFSDSD